METSIPHSPKFLRERKFMTVLPLLLLPFIILFFIALGGGRGANPVPDARHLAGINTILPDAHFKKGKEKDKLGLYEEARKDSAQLREQMKNDPYFGLEQAGADTFNNRTAQLDNILRRNAAKYHQPNYSRLQNPSNNIPPDVGEEKVIQKLSQLKAAMSRQTGAPHHDPRASADSPSQVVAGSLSNPEVNKLQNMLALINDKNAEPDPSISQLGGMLDKIMLVQHPEKMQDSMRKLSEKNKTFTYPVSTQPAEDMISLFDSARKPANRITERASSFYGLIDDNDIQEDNSNSYHFAQNQHAKQNTGNNAIAAFIPESQTLVSGASVRLRLCCDIFVNGIKIPKDEFVYGTAQLSNERLKISVNSLRYQQSILPVSLEVYDLDGMAGIYIPGSINRDVSKQSADEAISSVGLSPVDESVGAQAAIAGIQAAKTLAGKKIRLVRVHIPSGYQVLLKDIHQKN